MQNDPSAQKPVTDKDQADGQPEDGGSAATPATPEDARAEPGNEATGVDAPAGGEARADDAPLSPWQAEELVLAEMEKISSERDALRDQFLRTVAEMDNLRKRTEREKEDTAKYAVSKLAGDMLPLGDTIARAIAQVPADKLAADPVLKSFVEGVQLVEKQLVSTLERHGIVRFEPAGEKFDPKLHQAITDVEHPDIPSGHVADVMQAGFMIADRVLRPAYVTVSKGPGAGTTPPASRSSEGDATGPQNGASAGPDTDTGTGSDDAVTPTPSTEGQSAASSPVGQAANDDERSDSSARSTDPDNR